MDLNRAQIRGRLGQDPDVRYTQSDTCVANLSVATGRRYKDNNGEFQEETEWHRVTVWGKQAESVKEYLSKGSLVFIEGRLQTRKWEDKKGNERYTTEIVASRVDFLPSGSGNENGSSNNSSKMDSNTDLDDEDFDDIDDDLPF